MAAIGYGVPNSALNTTGWLNATKAPYSADPTGGTDATAALNDALAATPAGGVCYIPGGSELLISGILVIPDNVTLMGDPGSDYTGGSVIRVADGANLDAAISDSTWSSNVITENSTAPRVVGIIVDGNGANQTAGKGIGIAMSAYRGEVIGCRILDTRGDGIRLTNVDAAGTTITGFCVECKVIDNTVKSPGLGDLSGNTEGIAFRDSGASAVTDYWCQRNVVYGNPDTNGTGIWANSAGGAIISDNHCYGTGTDGIHITGSSETRITDNYVEYFGQLASSGATYGIYATDDGGGPGTVIGGNVINVDQAVSGNTFTCIFLTNPASGDPAFYSLGPNMLYTSVASATALTIDNQGDAANFVVAAMPQNANGFTSPYNINNYATITGAPFAGHQQPSYTSTMSVDPTQGTTITVVLGGDLTLELPAFFPSGMQITFIFQQPASGGTYDYTVTFADSGGYSGGGAWQDVTFTAATGANAFSAVAFVSDGYDLVQVGQEGGAGDWLNAVGAYGADPTGVSDSTTAIQDALTAAAPGQVVYLAAGTYAVSSPLSFPPGVVLRGASAAASSYWGDTGTTIKPKSTFSGSEVLYFPDVSHENTQGPQVFDIAIDGSALTTGTTHGINALGPVIEAYLHNVTISGMTGWGIMTSQDSSATITWPFEWHARKVFVSNCAAGGISLTSMTDSTWDDVYVLKCGGNPETGVATGPGWYIDWAGNAQFTNCRGEWSGTNGWHLTGAWWTGTGAGGLSMTGCSTDRNGHDGLLIDATGNGPVMITGFQSRRDGANGNAGGGGYSGVNIDAAAIPVIFSALSVFPGVSDDGTGTNSPEYGLSATSATAVSVESGYIQAATTAIHNGGSNSIFWVGPAVITAVGTPASPGSYANQIANSYQTFNGEIFAAAGIEVYGAVSQHISGTDTSGTATETVPTFTTATAKQLSTTQDVMLYVYVNTAVTFSLTFGSTSSASTTLVPSSAKTVDTTYGGFRIPKGWYVEVTCTTMADLTFAQVTC